MSLLSSAAVGFLLGMRHATDPDHVVAVSTIVARQPGLCAAARVGALWGLGHSGTVIVTGVLMTALGLGIPVRAAVLLEALAGIVLLILGGSALGHALRRTAATYRPVEMPLSPMALPGRRHQHAGPAARHAHLHLHGDHVHRHRHGHDGHDHGHAEDATATAWLDGRLGRWRGYAALRPVAVGVVHGLAGTAAIALLVVGTIRDPWWALVYLVVFGAGTIAGMVIITALVALPFVLSAGRAPGLHRGLQAASGLLGLASGAWILASSFASG